MCPEILEKFQILDVLWVVFTGGTHSIGESQSACRLLARRTAPSSSWVGLIPLRHALGQPFKGVLRLPLLKACSITADHQEIRGMPRRGLVTSQRAVVKLDACWLVVKLQDILITLLRIDRQKLHLTFKLDGAAHLHRWI